MSQENVELLRRYVEAFNRGDLEGALAIVDPPPEFEFVQSGVLAPDVAEGVLGPEEFGRASEAFWGEFDDPYVEVHDMIDVRDQVLIAATFRGRGKQSGVETSWHVWGVWTVRNGRALRFEGFTDRDAALKAAGVRE